MGRRLLWIGPLSALVALLWAPAGLAEIGAVTLQPPAAPPVVDVLAEEAADVPAVPVPTPADLPSAADVGGRAIDVVAAVAAEAPAPALPAVDVAEVIPPRRAAASDPLTDAPARAAGFPRVERSASPPTARSAPPTPVTDAAAVPPPSRPELPPAAARPEPAADRLLAPARHRRSPVAAPRPAGRPAAVARTSSPTTPAVDEAAVAPPLACASCLLALVQAVPATAPSAGPGLPFDALTLGLLFVPVLLAFGGMAAASRFAPTLGARLERPG